MDKIRKWQLGEDGLHVGFDSLPDQLVNKCQRKGFIFNILCIGETGIGKSTLMNTLFNTKFDSEPNLHSLPSVQLKSNNYFLKENNVQLKLTIVETEGYGDQMNKAASFQPIVDYVDEQFDAYLQEELKIRRCLSVYQDTRIHACLYFICPTGHGLKDIDTLCLQQLDSKVNIIPIIAKSDSISKPELQLLKEEINRELQSHGIKIYKFPTDDESVSEVNASMNANIPFAIVGSTEKVEIGNKMVRGREYPWGTVQVDNEEHCDFNSLREMLVRTNMEDLKEKTNGVHYEQYRKIQMEQKGYTDVDSEDKPMCFNDVLNQKLSLLLNEQQEKEEILKQKFVKRIEEKENEFQEAEQQLQSKLSRMKEEYTRECLRLEQIQQDLEDECANFHKMKMDYLTKPTLSTRRTFSLGTLGKGRKKST